MKEKSPKTPKLRNEKTNIYDNWKQPVCYHYMSITKK